MNTAVMKSAQKTVSVRLILNEGAEGSCSADRKIVARSVNRVDLRRLRGPHGQPDALARIAKRACDDTQKLGHNPTEWIGVCSGVFCCRDRWRPSNGLDA